MLRSIGNAITYVVSSPVRFYRWCVGRIRAAQRFLDRRRNHLCVAIVAVMMAVVGVQLRHAGYADARPGEYVALSYDEQPTAASSERPARTSLREAITDSLKSFQAKLPSLSGDDEPRQRTPDTPIEVPVIAASQQRSVMPTAPAIPSAPDVEVESKPVRQTLILPEPTVIDLTELEDPAPEEPDIAQLSGLIEVDSEDEDD